ncbi:MAG: hypothetical protein RL171_1521, partial [Pseudomonadota bacterium]
MPRFPEPDGFANAPLNDGAPEPKGAGADAAVVTPAFGIALVVEIARFDALVDGATAGAAAGAEGAEGADATAAGAAALAGSATGAAGAGVAAIAAGTTVAGAGVGA